MSDAADSVAQTPLRLRQTAYDAEIAQIRRRTSPHPIGATPARFRTACKNFDEKTLG
jgi:hypothetical protein